MSRRNESAPLFQKLFTSLFSGYDRNRREEKVREYVVHRITHGASFREVLREDYVTHNCTKEEIGEIVRDSRLIHEGREALERLPASGELDPSPSGRRR